MTQRRVLKKGVDAGVQDAHHYDTTLHPWRAQLRKMLLPFIRAETPLLADLQKRVRTPLLDSYFVWTANLGAHTFFMIFLPILIWFGNAQLGRSITCLAAFGVFWSGFVKDFLCLPRPLSPPVHRLTMSVSSAQEYGFPSTHSTNSVSVALYLMSLVYESYPAGSYVRLACMAGSFVYAASVVLGRIYCGMHSVTDVIGGTILAYTLYWVQWTFRTQFDALFTSESYKIFLAIPICLALVNLHPDPIERCPCFEDSVCFMGVMIGLFPGSWLCYRSDYCEMGLRATTAAMPSKTFTLLVILLKLVMGVAVLFAWRIACKKVCYVVLPPIYRVFNLPHRKYEVGARTYKTLRRQSIHPIPSVLDLHGMSNTAAQSEHVGIQSAIDLRERDATAARKHSKPVRSASDEAVLAVEKTSLRYDVDIVTKLIVYAGIGFMASHPVPVMFQLFFGTSI